MSKPSSSGLTTMEVLRLLESSTDNIEPSHAASDVPGDRAIERTGEFKFVDVAPSAPDSRVEYTSRVAGARTLDDLRRLSEHIRNTRQPKVG